LDFSVTGPEPLAEQLTHRIHDGAGFGMAEVA
jgi:hypothetical protein